MTIQEKLAASFLQEIGAMAPYWRSFSEYLAAKLVREFNITEKIKKINPVCGFNPDDTTRKEAD